VAQAGGRVTLVTKDPASSSLELHIVPGGEGAELMAPDGSLKSGVIARLVRYSVISFQSTRAEVRRDGLLQFTGELTVTHVTRETLPQAWTVGYSGASYAEPQSVTWTRRATFILAAPHAENLQPALEQNPELLATATLNDRDFPELPGALLDSYWPIVAQDEECSPSTGSPGTWGYRPGVCTGTAITVTPSFLRDQTTAKDYSGLRRYNAPVDGPVTLYLHLRLAPPRPAAQKLPGD